MLEADEREALLRALGAQESALTGTEKLALDRDGYVVFANLFDAHQVERMRSSLDDLIAKARLDPTWHAGGTLHLTDLINDSAFDPVWQSGRLLSAIVHVLGYDMRIGTVAYRAPKPGYGAQTLHADMMQAESGEYQAATAIIALVDFTQSNGPTRLIRGSHLQPRPVPTDADTPHAEQLLVTCPAGSAIVFNGHLQHSGTRNGSQETRHALQITFARRKSSLYGTARVDNATLERVGDAAFLFL